MLENRENRNEAIVTTSYEKNSNFRKKSVDDTKFRSAEGSAVRNVEGIELANDAVCPFGLAKNLEKQICIIPSRKKSKCPHTLYNNNNQYIYTFTLNTFSFANSIEIHFVSFDCATFHSISVLPFFSCLFFISKHFSVRL